MWTCSPRSVDEGKPSSTAPGRQSSPPVRPRTRGSGTARVVAWLHTDPGGRQALVVYVLADPGDEPGAALQAATVVAHLGLQRNWGPAP